MGTYTGSGGQRSRWDQSIVTIIGIVLTVSAAATCHAEGEVICWGGNAHGQCDGPALNEDFIAVAGGFLHSVGLKANGAVVAWGSNERGECLVPQPNSGFVAVSASGYHTVALRDDGSIVAWGDNSNGQCDPPEPNSGFVAVAAGGYHTLGLKSNGAIEARGLSGEGQCNVPQPNTGYVAVAGGYYHSLALRSDGSIATWGSNTYGQCDVPEPNSGFVAVAAGGYFSLGLRADGSVVGWGGNAWGQCNVPDPNMGFVMIDGGSHYAVGLRDDSVIVAWGANDVGQCDVPAPQDDFLAVAAGGVHGLALSGAQFSLQVMDVPDDQGGFLEASWLRHPDEEAAVPEPVTGYELQCEADGWQTVASVVADGAESYVVTFATDDVAIVGEPVPLTAYRLVASTADPAVFFVSQSRLACSVDNLLPPRPEPVLDEYGDVVVITWPLPDIPDYAEACVYKGPTEDFEPDEPLECTDSHGVVDELTVMAYYRVQFADTHGNLSEFSDIVHPTSTEAGDAPPRVLTLRPGYPNPFNPMTTLAFSLPEPGQVTVEICGAGGRRIAVLIDGALAAGDHQVVWNGHDATGRAVPSGAYICRLVTAQGTQQRKLMLLK